MGTRGPSPGVQRPGREAHYPPLSNAEVKNIVAVPRWIREYNFSTSSLQQRRTEGRGLFLWAETVTGVEMHMYVCTQ
jgi:hypothetical protein